MSRGSASELAGHSHLPRPRLWCIAVTLGVVFLGIVVAVQLLEYDLLQRWNQSSALTKTDVQHAASATPSSSSSQALASEAQAAGAQATATDGPNEQKELAELLPQQEPPGLDQLKSLLVPPAVEPGWRATSMSQLGQDKWVDKMLQHMRGGFVVESGAFDGFNHSNSIFFETQRGWDCLLVEASPMLQDEIVRLGRKCTLLKAGLSISNGPGSFKFKTAGVFGGIVDSMNEETRQRASQVGGPISQGLVDVPCFPLATAMYALGRTVIDYWSLDVEGAEPDVLEHTDFSHIEIGIITVEHNSDIEKFQRIKKALTKHGFVRAKNDGQDAYYFNEAYFSKRKLPRPIG
eukprot:gnl/TRDRNA2_/TRDRNA2_29570_c0_seq1.p1 gnl/TRDRNA2_/TRDRNA2_29570_c0~~gnl/TRDRNA2_/TRDRNA2_29570_c0_seq1.p1  ORF type:complete len:348 (+),score=64.06 gnl/TRDRNA2_/TRDRNA2_29570_c0_seq1:64-1107(+)